VRAEGAPVVPPRAEVASHRRRERWKFRARRRL